MKALYTWVVLTVVAAFGLLYELLPSSRELALMELEGGRYAEASVYYRKQYKLNHREPEVMMALVQIELHLGNVDQAISLGRELLVQHPEDPNILRMLADLYLANQQYQEYFCTLLQLDKVHSTPDSLQELATWYENANQPECLFPILQKLVFTDKADSSNFETLATFYAQKKEYANVVSTLENSRELFPKNTSINDVLFEVWALMKIGGVENEKKATLVLSHFLLEKKNVQNAYYALGMVRDRYPKLVQPLIAQLEPWVEKDPYLEGLALEILGRAGVLQKIVDIFVERI